MQSSLCGRYPCPGVCVRVCHCEAGLERSREEFAMYRNRREIYRTRASPNPSIPFGVNPETGEIYRTRYSLGRLKEAVLSNVFGTKEYPERRKPSKYGTRSLQSVSSWAPLLAFLILLWLVLTWGFILLGDNLVPTYTVPNVIYQDWE